MNQDSLGIQGKRVYKVSKLNGDFVNGDDV